MTRAVNRLVLGAAGLSAVTVAAALLPGSLGVRLPRWWPARLPHGPADTIPPAAGATLSAPHHWSEPLSLAVAAVGVLSLLLLLLQTVPRAPRRLRLAGGHVRTSALTGAVRDRAQAVPGVAGATARISRGKTPLLELTVRLSDRTTPAAAVEPLLAVLAEAADSTRLPLRPRLRLAPARGPRRHRRDMR